MSFWIFVICKKILIRGQLVKGIYNLKSIMEVTSKGEMCVFVCV